MAYITQENLADVTFQLDWQSKEACHTEVYAAQGVSLWRDWLPERLRAALMGKHMGETVRMGFSAAEVTGTKAADDVRSIARDQFEPERITRETIVPRTGRFYPKGLLRDLPNIFSANMEPFRCVALENGHLRVALNHPLIARNLEVTATVGGIGSKKAERGGTMRDWLGMAAAGAGMQSRWNGNPTDFFSDGPFRREDESTDDRFYSQPRFVQHIDDAARFELRRLHGMALRGSQRVLDLMSSWESHISRESNSFRVTGLGMNREELAANPQLSDFRVHDLNHDPQLPLAGESFDAVICALSVEYLVHPSDVFAEVARVLKPGGVFAVSFSNRWFAPKAIRIWKELHEFERMGLVSEYFLRSGRYTDLRTYSMRGLPRPADDKYFPRNLLADPLYAVWATRI